MALTPSHNAAPCALPEVRSVRVVCRPCRSRVPCAYLMIGGHFALWDCVSVHRKAIEYGLSATYRCCALREWLVERQRASYSGVADFLGASMPLIALPLILRDDLHVWPPFWGGGSDCVVCVSTTWRRCCCA